MPPTHNPSATYRIQFSLNFRFADACHLVPYLHELGVSHLYASPRFKARKGSSHGYDVTDPQRINSELGTEREFEELVERLEGYGMGLLLDIVPNHMAATAENPWWTDVLANGRSSPYASFFDIDWQPARVGGAEGHKILLPVLGDLYGRALENQEITLRLEENGFWFLYGEARFPLDPKSTLPILESWLAKTRQSLPEHHAGRLSVLEIIERVEQLPGREAAGAEEAAARRTGRESIRERLWRLYREEPELRRCLEETIREFNGAKGDPASFPRLDRLLESQAYRLACWRIASEQINYRRFFDVIDLVGLRVELPEVFAARHATILKLVEDGLVAGLRIDHVDGLYDPRAYLERLTRACAERSGGAVSGADVIVEKILCASERLPEGWPVGGTTGYDFLHAVNGLLIDPRGLDLIEAAYAKFTGAAVPFTEVSYHGNRAVIEQLFGGELRRLGRKLGRLAARDRYARDVPLVDLIAALADVTACLPVYRTYIASSEVSARDRRLIERALDAARARRKGDFFREFAMDFLRRVLTFDLPADCTEERQEWLSFVMQWQQFTGPVMAKGLEDTALYIHNSLISLNDVGGDPLRIEPPHDLAAFHLFNEDRQARLPRTLNATSTHDTKRSEDVRARINVLSELSVEWEERAFRWRRWNRPKKRPKEGREVPAPLEEMFLYQTMLGAWPLDGAEMADFGERLTNCMLKAAREAKIFTSWIAPQPEHEAALGEFIERILEGPEENRFLKDFLRFEKRIAFHGALNSLSQLLLKIASPGIPDFYQGSELWDFSLMDPDNRRPVDFAKRERMLAELAAGEHDGVEALAEDILLHWQDGRIKLFLTRKTLDFRRQHNALFLEGDYVPLYVGGKKSGHLCAFARRKGNAWAIVAVPLFTTGLVETGRIPLGRQTWGASAILLPDDGPREWHNAFTGETIRVRSAGRKKWLPLKALLARLPVALLEAGSAGHKGGTGLFPAGTAS
ncbi:MAG TPA: malto-oligosyltrehalose synthase [Patescibacteria group bacterium]|nr:malto-oligosyltrehalose synthase [Patescibacteria group bacterium]